MGAVERSPNASERPEKPPRVAVCVATHDRPQGLERLLDGLANLEGRCELAADLEVVVVDNAPSVPARDLCDRYRVWLPGLVYVVELRRGIPVARNRALDSVRPDTDFIVFIDDDEVPEPNWLDELLGVQRACDADMVAGPVHSYFPDPVPAWVLGNPLFRPKPHRNFAELPSAGTNNALVRAAICRELRFDEEMRFTGGSDADFFTRATRRGYRIVSAADAVTTEWVPAHRARAGWLVQRSFRLGNSQGIVARKLSPPSRNAVRVVMAGLRIGLGVVQLAVRGWRGRDEALVAVQTGAHALGKLLGVLGYRFAAYARAERRTCA